MIPPTAPTPVHLFGATGRTGAFLCRLLADRGVPMVPIVRDPSRLPPDIAWHDVRRADLTDAASLRAALADATAIASLSYAAWTPALLAAAPSAARLVITGTARRYALDTGAPDQPAIDAAAAEAALLASGRDGAILHPTMIYGNLADGTVSRLASLARRFPVLPLPAGGRQLVQPIHAADVAAAIAAALARPWPAPAAIPLGGPQPVPLASLIAATASAAGLRAPLILPIPAAIIRLAARRRPALLRLLQDRSVETATMQRELGVVPRPLAQGLAEMFG